MMTVQELRQLKFRSLYKQKNPRWNDSLSLLLKLFEPFAKKRVTILDAGCGRANYIVENFRENIEKAIGIDRDREAVLGNVCLDRIVIGNLTAMPFEDESFDVVVSQWVIEHLNEPEKVFSEIFRVTKKKGAFIFVTPYKYSYMLLPKMMLPKKVTKGLVNFFYGRLESDIFETAYKANTPKRLEKLLCKVGFRKQTLILNSDPSYLALNQLFFHLALVAERILNFIPFNLNKMHILGVFVKEG